MDGRASAIEPRWRSPSTAGGSSRIGPALEVTGGIHRRADARRRAPRAAARLRRRAHAHGDVPAAWTRAGHAALDDVRTWPVQRAAVRRSDARGQPAGDPRRARKPAPPPSSDFGWSMNGVCALLERAGARGAIAVTIREADAAHLCARRAVHLRFGAGSRAIPGEPGPVRALAQRRQRTPARPVRTAGPGLRRVASCCSRSSTLPGSATRKSTCTPPRAIEKQRRCCSATASGRFRGSTHSAIWIDQPVGSPPHRRHGR